MKVQHRAGYCFTDQTHAYNEYCTIVIKANYETFSRRGKLPLLREQLSLYGNEKVA